MIENFGIGIDIVDINRFKKIPCISKINLYEKIFLPSEIKYCLKYRNPYEHFAGKFAIKEAVKKSITEQISPLEIETSHSNYRPIVKLKTKKKINYIFLASISHEKNYAVGIVISKKLNNVHS